MFEAFSIDRPVNEEELPLGQTQTWMLEGTLRLAAEKREGSGIPEIEVEVFRLPERLEVPQEGKPRISTERGVWRYESASFSGEGSYEVLATVLLDGRSDWRSVTVKCAPKGAAYLRAIERDRKVRGASSVVAVKLGPSQLSLLKQELNGLQEKFFELFPSDLDGAEANVSRTLDLLDPVIPLHPNDWYLQNVRAYTFKNYAMVMRNRGKPEEFERALAEAKKMFESIREQNTDDPGAWNGLGSVALLQNDPEKALIYIDRALELVPTYAAAKKDRDTALRMLKQKEKNRTNNR